jgi:hypothetical protein
VEKSLRHPWITRNRYERIPSVSIKLWKLNTLRREYIELVLAVVFLYNFKKKISKSNNGNNESDYFRLINYISNEMKRSYIKKRDQNFEANFDEKKPSNKSLSVIVEQPIEKPLIKKVIFNTPKKIILSPINSPAKARKLTMDKSLSPSIIY